jgi:hypothetical protein
MAVGSSTLDDEHAPLLLSGGSLAAPPPPVREPTTRCAWSRLGGAIGLAVFCLCATVLWPSSDASSAARRPDHDAHGATSAASAAEAATAPGAAWLRVGTVDRAGSLYGALDSTRYYPWDRIVEPHKTSQIWIDDGWLVDDGSEGAAAGATNYTWTVAIHHHSTDAGADAADARRLASDDDAAAGEAVVVAHGPGVSARAAAHTFTHVGRLHTVRRAMTTGRRDQMRARRTRRSFKQAVVITAVVRASTDRTGVRASIDRFSRHRLPLSPLSPAWSVGGTRFGGRARQVRVVATTPKAHSSYSSPEAAAAAVGEAVAGAASNGPSGAYECDRAVLGYQVRAVAMTARVTRAE